MKMMGKTKHWGRWSIDKREDNRSARSQEYRLWSTEVDEWYQDYLDWCDEVDKGPGEYNG